MKRRRWVIKLVGLLLIGAVINVAVAWCSATFIGMADISESTRGFRTSPEGSWNVEIKRCVTVQRIEWFRSREPSVEHAEGVEPAELVPNWTAVSQDLPDNKNWLMWDVEARGAPFLSMWSTTKQASESGDGVRHLYEPAGSIQLPLADFQGGEWERFEGYFRYV